MPLVYESSDKEIFESRTRIPDQTGKFVEVVQRVTNHLSGDGNGYTNRVFGGIRYFDMNGREVVPANSNPA